MIRSHCAQQQQLMREHQEEKPVDAKRSSDSKRGSADSNASKLDGEPFTTMKNHLDKLGRCAYYYSTSY